MPAGSEAVRLASAVPPYRAPMTSKAAPEGAAPDESARPTMKFGVARWPFDGNVEAKILQDAGHVS